MARQAGPSERFTRAGLIYWEFIPYLPIIDFFILIVRITDLYRLWDYTD